MTATTEFLGFRFEKGSREDLFARLVAMSSAPFGYVVTPNVDLVNRAARDAEIRALYDGATVHLCDSKILTVMAKTKKIALDCYPGWDGAARDSASRLSARTHRTGRRWSRAIRRCR
jgi:UDP-N-acetyl-D-mannosaminuronic acid transferase (WecB/TagA/CpsF family)